MNNIRMGTETIPKYILFLFLLVPLISCTAGNKNSPNNIQFIQIKKWQYRLGDSPIDSNGNLLWLKDSINSGKWISINNLDNIPHRKEIRSIWLRTTLPGYKFIDPVIYLGQVEQFFQVYLNKKLIYHLGDFSSINKVEFLGWHQNLVPLPRYQKGDLLTIRIKCKQGKIGPTGHILIGNANDFYNELFFNSADNLVFISIFFFIGLTAFIIYFGFKKTNLILSVGIFLVPISIFIAANTLFLQMLINAPRTLYQLDHFSLYVATIGGLFAIEQIVAKKYKKIMRAIWLLHAAYMAGDIISNIFFGITHPSKFAYFLLLLTVDMIIAIILMILSARKGNLENKILLSGMIIFMICAIAEVGLFFMSKGTMHFGYSINIIHFGVLFFVISLISIIVLNYIKTNRDKEIAQKKVLEATKRESKAQSEFSAKLIELQEQERKRIASELHDSIGQDLLIVKNMLLVNKEKRYTAEEEIPKMLSKTIRAISGISHNLRPFEIDELGLTMAVEAMVDRIHDASGIKFKLNIENIDEIVPVDDKINLFRIFQEALNNIVKHSKATEVVIDSRIENNFCTLQVKDNGTGFVEMESIQDNRPHFGLAEMRERIKLLKGQLQILSGKKNGTTIKLLFQIKNDE